MSAFSDMRPTQAEIAELRERNEGVYVLREQLDEWLVKQLTELRAETNDGH